MSKLNDFMYGLSLLETMYGIEMEDDMYTEIALQAYRLIGNKKMRIYRYKTCVNQCEEGILLPCNAAEGQIEAVTLDAPDWDSINNRTLNGDYYSMFTEEYIEERKGFRHPLYARGKFVKYELQGDKLYFDRPHGPISVLYRGEELDDDGLPSLTDSEALAIATFCAYVDKFKESLNAPNKNSQISAETLRQQWLKRCDQARTDLYLSQNEWDEILDAQTNWSRKQHSKSFKVVK